MKQVTTKMITVESRGYVMTSRGRVMTPIRTPYRENVDRIWTMITQDRATVMEHLNGNKIPLTALNFDADNSVKEKKNVAPAAPQEDPDGGVKVVSDIKTPNNGVQMRTGDVFSTDPAKVQNHHADNQTDNNKGTENPTVENGQGISTPAAPQENRGTNPSNNQQNGKFQNNQNNGGKNKHNKNKGNGNNQNQNQNQQKQSQVIPKTEDKKDEKSEPSVSENPAESEKPAEPTTGADLAVTPETV